MKTAADRRRATAALLNQLAASIDATSGVRVDSDAATTSLVQQLSTTLAKDELEAMVRLLSSALTVAETRMRDVRRARVRTEQPYDPAYWLG